MNKKLLGLGAAVVAGFLTLTAFEAKTLEQQRAEINAAVETRLSELRMQKDQECMMRVQDEARRRFDEMMITNAANNANAPRSGRSGNVTKARGPKAPAQPTQPDSKSKWNQGQQQTRESQSKWEQGQKPDGTNKQDPNAGQRESRKKWQQGTGGGGR